MVQNLIVPNPLFACDHLATVLLVDAYYSSVPLLHVVVHGAGCSVRVGNWQEDIALQEVKF